MTEAVSFRSARGRGVLAATVLGSGMAFLDSTVVNVALPSIGADLDAEVAGLQWILSGYLLTLAALILLGGSLGDHFGRRRVFVAGVIGFAASSALCAVAPTVQLLILARLLQGATGALLAPGSLAIIEASFVAGERPAAIGAWSGLAGVSTAVGPVVGGLLVDAGSWRWIFLLNLPIAAVVVVLALRFVPETSDPDPEPFDVTGAVLATAGLAAITWALIAAGERGAGSGLVVGAGATGVVVLTLFAVLQLRSSHPMLPPSLFSSAQFTGANLVTFAVYAALGATFFLLVVHLQQVLDYSALEAGLASVPITALMLVLSSPSGALAERIGPRTQMTVGPLICAVGLALMVRIDAGDTYIAAVLPAVAVLGFGLATTVAPLTATALAAVDDRHAGLASGVNNATARTAQLAAIAAVPVVAGITGEAYRDPGVFTDAFDTAMWITAALAALGGVIAFAAIRNPLAEAEDEEPGEPAPKPRSRIQCGFDAPVMDHCPRAVREHA